MLELDLVLTDYTQTKISTPLVPGENRTPALQALRDELPAALRGMLAACGYNASDFYIKGSAGEPNRSFAKVPWAAVFKKTISKSATKGYYVVMLFAEDMSSVTLSLNQGYTAFEKRYISRKLAYQKLKDCAAAALGELAYLPAGFVKGPISLNTDGNLAKGYEAGSILSKTYLAGATPPASVIQTDLEQLLKCYLDLASHYPDSLIDLDVGVSDSDLMDAAMSPAVAKAPSQIPSGPQPLPPKSTSGSKTKFARSPKVLADALSAAKATCVFSTPAAPHLTFTSARSGRNYVEGHHIVPFSQQVNFPHSLDIEENIAVLCPTCHCMLHYGTGKDKSKRLVALLSARNASLLARGINVSANALMQMYKALDCDD